MKYSLGGKLSALFPGKWQMTFVTSDLQNTTEAINLPLIEPLGLSPDPKNSILTLGNLKTQVCFCMSVKLTVTMPKTSEKLSQKTH